MNNNLVAYYADRAREYEKIYEKPERQGDLAALEGFFQSLFSNKDVFEIACGTGYWTQRIAKTAASVLATDINQAVIDVAKAKTYEKGNVQFSVADIYTYKGGPHKSLFAGFILSHIKHEELEKFVECVNGFVERGGVVLFADNTFTNESTPILHTDDNGNTYQERVLENGNTYSVLKNFHTLRSLSSAFNGKADNVRFMKLHHYWVLMYNRK